MSALLQNILVGLLVGAASVVLLRRWLPQRTVRQVLGRVLAHAPSRRAQGWAHDLLTPPAQPAALSCGSSCSSCGGCARKQHEQDVVVPAGQSDRLPRRR
ncbi:MAG: DUF6587 family protein [Metallibacterium scheffleri]|jgi:hypothetical protein